MGKVRKNISIDDAGRPVYNHIYFGIWKDGGDLSTSIKFKFLIRLQEFSKKVSFMYACIGVKSFIDNPYNPL